ncbi:MAG: hypothetical protein WC227_01170 [Patescibacteria group bacterium]|jgi:hypothetical protein
MENNLAGQIMSILIADYFCDYTPGMIYNQLGFANYETGMYDQIRQAFRFLHERGLIQQSRIAEGAYIFLDPEDIG